MQALRSLGRTVLHSLGGVPAFRRLNRRGVRILMYHRFPADTHGLRKQCEHIRRYYQPVSLQAVAESLRMGKSLSPHAVTVTVDDGHRDFLFYGHPVFREFGIPSTIYPVSDFLDGKLWVWQNQVHYLTLHTNRKSLSLAVPTGAPLELAFSTPEQRTASADKIVITLNGVKNAERLQLLELIPKLLEVRLPAKPPTEHEPLSWDEVRGLAREGVEVGAHTKTHPLLSKLQSMTEMRDEVAGCKRRLEEELDRQVLHFCYPNGLAADFNDETVEVVEQSGYRTAVTAILGINSAGAHPFLLRRVGVNPKMPGDQFHEALAGVQSRLYNSPVVKRLAGL